MNGAISVAWVKEWWPLLAAVGVGLVAWGEMRWEVRDLRRDQDVDTAQGMLLTDHDGRIFALEQFNKQNFDGIEQDKRHWGAILDQWPRRLIQLDDHERRLIQMETLSGRPVGGE